MKLTQAMFASLVGAALSTTAFAGAHSWQVNEAFSNASGTIQFVELHCGPNGENFPGGLQVKSDSTGLFVTLNNVPGDTFNRSILLGTAAYAALPGAPAPDYIIPSNFFNRNGDTIRYHVYHSLTFGALPTDCVSSFNLGTGVANNSPRNLGGASTSVNCNPVPPPCPSDISPPGGNGFVNTDDLLAIINAWGRCQAPPTPCPADLAPPGGNSAVNTDDLLAVINAWGQCPQ